LEAPPASRVLVRAAAGSSEHGRRFRSIARVVLASVAAATEGFGISLFARLVPDLRAGFVIGFAGPALGSLSEGIGLRPAMLLAYGCILPPRHAGPAETRQPC
jgi:hypothetical protein